MSNIPSSTPQESPSDQINRLVELECAETLALAAQVRYLQSLATSEDRALASVNLDDVLSRLERRAEQLSALKEQVGQRPPPSTGDGGDEMFGVMFALRSTLLESLRIRSVALACAVDEAHRLGASSVHEILQQHLRATEQEIQQIEAVSR